MVLQNLDRTLWSFSNALAHVERVAVAERTRAWWRHMFGRDAPARIEPSDLPQSLVGTAHRGARDEILVALRDGYLRATGRLSHDTGTVPG